VTDPPRLIGSGDALERSLLGSWDTRQPDEAARARTLAALGIGVVAVGAGAATALGSMGSLAPKAAIATSLIVKWMAIGAGLAVTTGLVGYAGYTTLVAPITGSPAVVAPPPVAVTPAAPRAARPPVAPPASPRDPADDLSVETLPAPAPRAASPRPTSATGSASTLEDEVYAIDQARRALTSGNAASALSLVDAYDAHYPGGSLAQESAEIRIEALYRTGKHAQADKLATRFLAAHPDSPYAREIRALMASSP
jgi:hypothetical protein